MSRNPNAKFLSFTDREWVSPELPPVAVKGNTTLGDPLTASQTCLDEPPDRSPPLNLKQSEALVGMLLSRRSESARPPDPLNEAPPVRLANLDVPQQSCLPDQVITRIKAIVMSKDEAGLADYLSGEATQTLIDVTQEVCLRIS